MSTHGAESWRHHLHRHQVSGSDLTLSCLKLLLQQDLQSVGAAVVNVNYTFENIIFIFKQNLTPCCERRFCGFTWNCKHSKLYVTIVNQWKGVFLCVGVFLTRRGFLLSDNNHISKICIISHNQNILYLIFVTLFFFQFDINFRHKASCLGELCWLFCYWGCFKLNCWYCKLFITLQMKHLHNTPLQCFKHSWLSLCQLLRDKANHPGSVYLIKLM